MVRLALDKRVRALGYIDWKDFITSLGLQDEPLAEVIWILRDIIEPYRKEIG